MCRTDEEIDALANQAAAIFDGEEDGHMNDAEVVLNTLNWLRGQDTRPL